MTTRRHFLGWACSSALLCASVHGQAARKTLRLGYVSGSAENAVNLPSLEKGLRDLGYVEGRNLAWEKRFADGNYDRLPALVAELIRLKVDILVVGGGTAADVAHKATSTLPLVIIVAADPVANGFVKSLARPGGNLTGATSSSGPMGPKRFEILLELAPNARRVGFLFNAANPTFSETSVRAAGAALKRDRNVELLMYMTRSPSEIQAAFADMKRDQVAGLIVPPDSLLSQQERQIAQLAIDHRLPSVGGLLRYATAGGLAGHGANYDPLYYQAASYVDKIARGANPGELPIFMGNVVELWVNQRTAARLGIDIPPALLARANSVIQ